MSMQVLAGRLAVLTGVCSLAMCGGSRHDYAGEAFGARATPVAAAAELPSLSVSQRQAPLGTTQFDAMRSMSYPLDYRFTYRISGYGFRAGETVLVSNSITHTETSVAASNAGSFVVRIPLDWAFCVSGGRGGSPAQFSARGRDGDSASVLDEPSCPLVQAWETVASPKDGPYVPTPGTVSAQPAPTPPIGSGVAPAVTPATSTAPLQVAVQGFGFRSRARVQVSQITGTARATVVAVATADAWGRISVLAVLSGDRRYVACGRTRLLATEAGGTKVSGAVHIRAPSAIGAPCALPASKTDPVGYTISAGLRLLAPVVARGGSQGARLVASRGEVTVYLRYPGGAHRQYELRVQRRGLALAWHVPRDVPPGRAVVLAVLRPGRLTLRAQYSVV